MIKTFAICVILNLLLLINTFCQFAPAAGIEGTTAISADSNIFISWATSCVIQRGHVDISDPSYEYDNSSFASYGTENDACGQPDNVAVSLGDRGNAVISLSHPIINGSGPDFAVFENSFDDYFLELAFVEVSTDGEHFTKFNSISNTQSNQQISTFGIIDATQIHNFAGKYRALYGTPFDLDELKDSSGIDIMNINFIRITDVVGNISLEYCSYDSHSNPVNDPWPTPFNTCGFDLDAVGIIHNSVESVNSLEDDAESFNVFPNPVNKNSSVIITANQNLKTYAVLYDLTGKIIIDIVFKRQTEINTDMLENGVYLLSLISEKSNRTIKLIVN